MTEPRLLANDLVIGESARWHDGRLWLSNWGAAEILAFDLDGHREVITQVPSTIPFSIDWLPDGRLLVVAGQEQRLLRQEADGSLVDHVDLSGLPGNLNEIVVDGRGTIYVNGGNDFYPDEGVAPGFIAAITSDGVVRQVADELAFPNGMAVTEDNSTLIIAESFAGKLTAFDISDDGSLENRRTFAEVMADGICMDADGAVWTPSWYRERAMLPTGGQRRRGAGSDPARASRLCLCARRTRRPHAGHAERRLAHGRGLQRQPEASDRGLAYRTAAHRHRYRS